MLEVKVRDEISENHDEDCNESQDSQPDQHKGAFILSRRRRGDAEDEMQSPKEFCEILDHEFCPGRVHFSDNAQHEGIVGVYCIEPVTPCMLSFWQPVPGYACFWKIS